MGLFSTLIRKIVKPHYQAPMKNLAQMRVIVLTRIMSGPALENAQTKGDDPMGRFVLPCKAKHCI